MGQRYHAAKRCSTCDSVIGSRCVRCVCDETPIKEAVTYVCLAVVAHLPRPAPGTPRIPLIGTLVTSCVSGCLLRFHSEIDCEMRPSMKLSGTHLALTLPARSQAAGYKQVTSNGLVHHARLGCCRQLGSLKCKVLTGVLNTAPGRQL